MTNSRNKGARFEREVAKAFNTSRHTRCSYGESAPDIINDDFVIECKIRNGGIGAIRYLEQCEKHKLEGKICIVVAKEDRKEPFVIIRLKDFLELSRRNRA